MDAIPVNGYALLSYRRQLFLICGLSSCNVWLERYNRICFLRMANRVVFEMK